MKLYITRHGKTEWNLESRFQGVKDSNLVESGIRDAITLGKYIQDQHFDKIYTSPILRARRTCELIFPNHEIIDEPLIKEMNFGAFEGLKTSDILEQYHDLYDNLWNHPEQYTRAPEGGESYEEVRNRVKLFLGKISQLDSNANVFIVTHGMYFICLLGYLLGYDEKDFVKINRYVVRGCSLTIVDIDNGKYQIECMGDDHYLVPEEKSTYLIKK